MPHLPRLTPRILSALFMLMVVSGSTWAQRVVHFPQDFSPDLHGKEVIIEGPLYVTGNWNYTSTFPKVTMAPEVLYTPTDVVMPGMNAQRQALWNKENKLTVTNFRTSTPVVRVGAYAERLQGVVSFEDGSYTLRLETELDLEGNERPDCPFGQEPSPCNLRIVSANLQFFLASPSAWGSGWGASNSKAFERQRTKIVTALAAMDADIYALCEIEEGNYTSRRLADWLNDALGVRVFEYIDLGDTHIDTYTKNTFIYRSDRVCPVSSTAVTDEDYLRLRHIAQRFRLLENGEELIVAMNHFKAKGSGGKGADKDQGDGQGGYNISRVEEAEAVLAACKKLIRNTHEEDLLVVGDLNAYSYEDPIRTFTDAGYVNELKKHAPDRWSYCYNNEVGNLDQALATPSLDRQVVQSTPWDINASELTAFGYSSEVFFYPIHYMARYSDHNPILTSIDLGGTAAISSRTADVSSSTVRVLDLHGIPVLTLDDIPSDVAAPSALWERIAPQLSPGVYILVTPSSNPIKFVRQ